MVAAIRRTFDLDRLGAAEALELALLQHAQQLHLRLQVDVADFVEEQRAALGQLEAALAALVRVGERALLVAEQLRLDQRVGQRAAAHLDERLGRPQRVVVDRVRDQLLAGARLAADQHGGVGARDLRDLIEHAAHRAAGADQVGEVVLRLQLLAQVRVLVDQPLALGLDEALQPHRLADHRGDDAEELRGADVEPIGLERQLDEQRADRPAGDGDRHADDAELLGLAALGRADGAASAPG